MTIKEMRLLLQVSRTEFSRQYHIPLRTWRTGKVEKESAKLRSGTVGTRCKGRRRKELDMAWYEGTYACGHEGRVNIIGRKRTGDIKKKGHSPASARTAGRKSVMKK